ncbi:MAG: AAA family ATPase, partial [Chloroflexi bacterium]|nr:AAA family ATPase [Chloroflexota bacterium]
MSPLLQIRLLGGFDLSSKGGVAPALRGTKPRSLFAFLALHRALPHTRDELAGLFWPDASDAVARRRLSQALWRIRRGFQAAGLSPPLISQADLVRFDESANYWLDVTAFEQAVREGLDGMAGMAEVERASRLERAAALYQGELMAGFYEDWIILERERLREMHLNALERLVALYEHLGAYEEALHYARRLAAEEPLRERAHYEVMQLCRRLNRPQEALKQYERLVAILAEDLGASPSLPVQRLYRQLASATKWETAPRPQRASARMTAPLLVDAAALPLVGRKAERAQLLTLVDDALRGAGGMALVEGEAGVGKTRLLQEIARDAAWREMRTLWGRGRDLAARPSYDALLEAVRAGLSPLRASQLAQLLSRGELETLTLLLPELRDWLPQLKGPTATVGSERLSQALSRLALALGEIAPHLILLEDLHWADAGVLETLVQLAETLGRRRREGRPSRLLLIVSYRGEDAREREEVWSSLRRLAQAAGIHPLRLSRLAARETGELVRQALGLMEPAPRFEARIYDESEGNPLFVLETLRALMDEEMLFCDAAGQWRTPFDETTRDYGELPVPPGVVQVIERRLRRLPPDLRIVLDAAAVLGREFDYPLLAHVLTRSPRVILDALTELMQRGFLLEESSGYAFAHDKIRQVTYEAM